MESWPISWRWLMRNKDVTLQQIRKSACRPELVIGTLAYVSGLIDGAEPVTAKELLAHFRLEAVPPARAVCLPDKLLRKLLDKA